jgi:hypothetical protein
MVGNSCRWKQRCPSLRVSRASESSRDNSEAMQMLQTAAFARYALGRDHLPGFAVVTWAVTRNARRPWDRHASPAAQERTLQRWRWRLEQGQLRRISSGRSS